MQPSVLARRLDTLHRRAWPRRRCGHARAEDLSDLISLGPGDVVYLDPPYVGRTGYILRADREAVITIAQTADRAGAIVAISEAVDLVDCLGPSWFATDLTRHHNGKGVEILTMNRPPIAQRQLSLIGAL